MAEPRWGFSDVWWPTLAQNVGWMRELGCTAIRCPISKDPVDWWAVDEVVSTVTPMRAYVGAFGWGGGPTGPPTPDVFADYWRRFAERFGTSTNVWLWNEPNLNHPDDLSESALSVSKVTELCDAGAQAIHDVNPDARIIGPNISPVDRDIEPMTWQDYQARVYDQLPNYVHVGINVYPVRDDPDERLAEVRAHYDTAKETGRPVHVLELDMALPHHHQDTSVPQLTSKAIGILKRRGARTILFNSVENHRAEATAIAKAL